MSETAPDPYEGIEERFDQLNRETGLEVERDEVDPGPPPQGGMLRLPGWASASSFTVPQEPLRLSLHTGAMPNVSVERGGISYEVPPPTVEETDDEETMFSDAQETRCEAAQQARFILERRGGLAASASTPPPVPDLIRLAEWIVGEG